MSEEASPDQQVNASPDTGSVPDASPAGEQTPAVVESQPTAEQIAEYEAFKQKCDDQNVDPSALYPEFIKAREDLAVERSTRQQYEQQYRSFVQQQAAERHQADPADAAFQRMNQAIDADEQRAARIDYENALQAKFNKGLEPAFQQFSNNILKTIEGRQHANEFGVTEQDVAKTLAQFNSGNVNMEAIAKLAAIEKGTYDRSLQAQQEGRDREARMAELISSGAEGRADGPGRLPAAEAGPKPNYNMFEASRWLNGDGSVNSDHRKAFTAYVKACDPNSVPASHASLT